MSFCSKCGFENPAGAKFCGHCGAPLNNAPSPTPTPEPVNSTGIPEEPKGNSSKWIYIIGGVVIAILTGVLLWVNLRIGEKDEQAATVDSVAVIPAIAPVEDSMADTSSAQAKPTAAKESSSESFNGSGTIDGYPFSISGKWNDDRVTGTYINNYNGVKMKVSGSEAEGVLELTLTSGSTKCYLTLDDMGGGYYTGTYNNGEKPAAFQLK